MSISIETITDQHSFKKGWNKVPNENVREVRIKIMAALDINRANFYKRLNGEVEPKVSEARAIEGVFQQYGVTNIWGK